MSRAAIRKRVKSGIPGLDETLGGGIPDGSRLLLAGGAGCGKTIFSAQYVYNGVKLFREPAVYVCTEEPPQEFIQNLLPFGWNLERLERRKKLYIVDAVYTRMQSDKGLQEILYNLRTKLSEVKLLVEEMRAKRLVIDSLPGFGFRVTETETLREIFLEVGLLLKDVGCTTIMTTEIVEGSQLISRYGIEEFLATGVIVLRHERNPFGHTVRKLWIKKMRGTAHSLAEHTFIIGSRGISIGGGMARDLTSLTQTHNSVLSPDQDPPKQSPLARPRDVENISFSKTRPNNPDPRQKQLTTGETRLMQGSQRKIRLGLL